MGGTRVCVGVIKGAHGVRGLVRLKSFTEVPEDVAAYGPVSDEAGTPYRLAVSGRAKDALLVRIAGVEDRDRAQALAGTRLYVARAALPAVEADTYYHADLIGLAAETSAGRALGKVVAVHDFGAGDLLEIEDAGRQSGFYPFTRAVVPLVDLEGGRIVVDPPDETEARAGAGEDEA
jgi:16S rRNA processing protein RimM